MYRKLMILFLCAAFLLPIAAQADDNTLVISTAQAFTEFAENCRIDSFSQDLTVRLTCDIDLTGIPFSGVPIFCGTFRGDGHKITGIAWKETGSNAGVFRYLTNTATVSDLAVEGDFSPEGSKNYVGGIAGSNAGLIEKCSLIGKVSGNSYVGGIVGINQPSGIIRNSMTQGEILGIHFVGGIAGDNRGLIENCENAACVNTTPVKNDLRLEDITVESITGTEPSATATDIGGIAGNSMGVIMESVNRGDVGYAHVGYNVGGIAGVQMGYIAGCQNTGKISGRKEVGGIVGQLEPVTYLEYNKDTLQMLREELDTLAVLTDAALQNSNSNMLSIQNQLKELRSYVESAQTAIESLLVLPEPGQAPQWESYLPAWNGLTSNLQKAMKTVIAISESVEDTTSTAQRDLEAVYEQVAVIRSVLDSDTENLGGSVSDVSDSDAQSDSSAKVYLCSNYGEISGDFNTGGIVGAMAIENDLDPDSDVQITGSVSLNFDTRLRAVVLMCTNDATVTGDKSNTGGIVGLLYIGLVKNSVNTGKIHSINAKFAGGIAGISTGFIRNCYARCEIFAKSTAGGIAGQANCVSDCGAITVVQASEKKGAILGDCDDRAEIVNNFYYPVSADFGGIDGISYAGSAQPCQREQLPDSGNDAQTDDTVTVSFCLDDTVIKVHTMPIGQALDPAEIPNLSDIPGFTGKWQNIPADILWFDVTVEASYEGNPISIQSAETNEDGRPLLLAVGVFSKDAVIRLQDCTAAYPLQKGQSRVCEFAFETENVQLPAEFRYLVKESFEPENAKLYVYSNDQWLELPYKRDGRYIVFSVQEPGAQLALIETQSPMWIWIIAAGSAVMIIAAISLIVVHLKKKKYA